LAKLRRRDALQLTGSICREKGIARDLLAISEKFLPEPIVADEKLRN
jgi:hypothetical protein